MKILNFSLDQSLLNRESVASRRISNLGGLVERYLILVPARFNSKLDLTPQVAVTGVGGKNKPLSAFRLLIKATEILNNTHFDLITVQDVYFLALIAWYLAKKFKLPLEIQVHGFERFSGWRKILARFLLPKATGVRVVSQRLKKQLIADFKIEPAKITVIPITNEFKCDPTPALIPRDESAFIFLTVARLVKVKNIAGELRALAKLRQAYPQAHLWLVGDGPERQRLEHLSAQLNLGEAVKFWGQRKDLSSFYRSADAFVLFSDSEGWGLSVIEAGTCVLPVVMSDVGCAGEVVKDDSSGLVVPVGDESALVKAMKRLLDDGELRQTLVKGLTQELVNLPSQAETFEAYRTAWTKLIRK